MFSPAKEFEFYSSWLKQGLWSFDEATKLFVGMNPLTILPEDKSDFIKVSDIWGIRPFTLYLDKFRGCWSSLEELALKHVEAGILRKENYGDEPHFKPAHVIQWLLEYTLHKPSTVLLELLELGKSDDLYLVQNIAVPKSKTVDLIPEFYKKALPIFIRLKEENKKDPSLKAVIYELQKLPQFSDIPYETIRRHMNRRKLITYYNRSLITE